MAIALTKNTIYIFLRISINITDNIKNEKNTNETLYFPSITFKTAILDCNRITLIFNTPTNKCLIN